MKQFLFSAMALSIGAFAFAQQDPFGTNITDEHQFFLTELKESRDGDLEYLTRYTYNSDLTQLTKKEYFQIDIYDNNREVLVAYNLFKYDENNRLKEVEEYAREEEVEDFKKQEVLSYTYDDKNRLTSWTKSILNSAANSFRDAKKYEFTYDPQLNRVSSVAYHFSTESVPLTKIYDNAYHYDEKDLLTETVIDYHLEDIIRRQNYNYDEQGLHIGGSWTKSVNQGEEQVERRYTLVRDENTGNITSKQSFKLSRTGDLQPNIRFNYVYDNTDLTPRNIYYFKSEIDYALEDLDDSRNAHTKKIALFNDSEKTFEYVYTDRKKLNTKEISNKEIVSSVVYPNPTNGAFNIKTNANIQQVEVIDFSGKLLKTFGKQDSYNINDLKAGAYIINVKSDNNTKETLKLIKK